MANGNVWPSATGGGLTKGATAILNAMMARREFEQRDRQLSQRDRELDMADRAAAMERMVSFAPFLPGDAPLSEVPFLHEDFKKVFGEGVDPSDPNGAGAITLNNVDLQTAVGDRLKEILAELPADSPFLQRGVARALVGENVSGTELEARDVGAEAQSMVGRMTMESFGNLMRDPQARTAIQRSLAGLEVPVRLTLPDGREVAFDTEAAARISAQLWMHRDEMSLGWNQIKSKDALDLAGEFMDQLSQFDLHISRPKAQEIIEIWNASVIGDYEPGESPIEQMARSAEARGDWDELTAIRAWLGTVDYGDSSMRSWLESTPNGQAMLKTYEILNNFAEVLDRETVGKLAPSLLEAFSGQGVGQIKDPPIGAPRFIIPDLPPSLEQGPPPAVQGDAVPARPGSTSPNTDAAVEQQRLDLAVAMQSDATLYSQGKLTRRELLDRWGEREIVNTIIRVAAGMGGGG